MIKTVKSKKKIEFLFEKGLSFKNKGVFIKGCLFKDSNSCYGVSVPKKFFKSAVKRNLIKRRLKESVRNSSFVSLLPEGVCFFLIYNQKKVVESNEIFSSVEFLLEKLIKGLED